MPPKPSHDSPELREQAPSAQYLDHWAPRAVVLLAVLLLAFFRTPEILLEGRFWAEGGSVYFRTAVEGTAAQALLSDYGGYYSLLNSLGAIAATWVALESAPLVTGYLSLAVMLLPSFLVLFLPNRLGIQGWRRCLLGALIAFPTTNAEVWLNLINNQFWLGVAAGLVLMLDTRRSWTLWVLAPLLTLAVLTGPVTALLLPFFALRALIERERTFICLTLIVAAGATLQGILMVQELAVGPPRGTPYPLWANAYAGVVKLLVYPFAGDHARLIRQAARDQEVLSLAIWFAVALTVGTYLLWRAARLRRPYGLLLLFSIFAVTAVCLYGASGFQAGHWSVLMGLVAGGRYFLYGNLILLVLLCAPSGGARSRLNDGVALLLVALMVNSAQWSYGKFRQEGPSWRSEVQAWRGDPTRELRIWPEGWVISLDPEKVR